MLGPWPNWLILEFVLILRTSWVCGKMAHVLQRSSMKMWGKCGKVWESEASPWHLLVKKKKTDIFRHSSSRARTNVTMAKRLALEQAHWEESAQIPKMSHLQNKKRIMWGPWFPVGHFSFAETFTRPGIWFGIWCSQCQKLNAGPLELQWRASTNPTLTVSPENENVKWHVQSTRAVTVIPCGQESFRTNSGIFKLGDLSNYSWWIFQHPKLRTPSRELR